MCHHVVDLGCNLFYNVVSMWWCIAFNSRMIGEQWFGRKCSWPNLDTVLAFVWIVWVESWSGYPSSWLQYKPSNSQIQVWSSTANTSLRGMVCVVEGFNCFRETWCLHLQVTELHCVTSWKTLTMILTAMGTINLTFDIPVCIHNSVALVAKQSELLTALKK